MNTEVNGLTPEMVQAYSASFKTWAELGWPNAVIPIYHDVDEDGRPDYLGMNAFGQVEVLSEDQVEAKDETVVGYDGPAWVRR